MCLHLDFGQSVVANRACSGGRGRDEPDALGDTMFRVSRHETWALHGGF